MRHSYAKITKDEVFRDGTRPNNNNKISLSADQYILTIMDHMFERFERTIERILDKMMDRLVDLVITRLPK